MTPTQLQNPPPVVNIMNEVKTGTVDTPANNTLEGDEENPTQNMIANISYPSHESLGVEHIVINKVGDPDVKAKYKILVQNKQAQALFDSGASIPVKLEKFYKHLPYAVKVLKHDDTNTVNVSRSNLCPARQCYLTFKLGNGQHYL